MGAEENAEFRRRIDLVANNYNGILPHCMEFYLVQIRYMCERCTSAFRRMRFALVWNEDPNEAFSSLQEALIHAGALSRFFWPSSSAGDLGKRRGETLRRKLAVSDESPLRDRKLRNEMEHFDEMMDKYLVVADSGFFFPTPLVRSHHVADSEIGHYFKLLDPVNNICVILGRKYDYGQIEKEIRDISAQVSTSF